MDIYLPIAELSINVFVLLGLGGAAGLLAGMFGVGGGFLATPLLIFVGIPPAVAVASQANQVVANSISSLQVHWRRGNVDLRMGLVLLLGGMIGSSAGVSLFTWLKAIGQIPGDASADQGNQREKRPPDTAQPAQRRGTRRA